MNILTLCNYGHFLWYKLIHGIFFYYGRFHVTVREVLKICVKQRLGHTVCGVAVDGKVAL